MHWVMSQNITVDVDNLDQGWVDTDVVCFLYSRVGYVNRVVSFLVSHLNDEHLPLG